LDFNLRRGRNFSGRYEEDSTTIPKVAYVSRKDEDSDENEEELRLS